MKKIAIFVAFLTLLSGCQKNVTTSKAPVSKYENLPMCTNEEDERAGNYFYWLELGNKLSSDNATPANYQKSMCLYKKALAVKDIPEAKYNIAIMYFNGQGVAKDLQQARQWFLKANSSEKGFPPASFALGTMYLDGNGVKKDYGQAIEWLEKAGTWSSRDYRYTSANTYLLLGQMYYHGMGVKKDNKTAYAYFWLSSLTGNEEAKHDLDIVKKKLSKKQLNDALQIINRLNEKYHVLLSNPFPSIEQGK